MLIGPSGSGKTTLLRMVNRMVDPDEGRVLINKEDIRGLDPVGLRRAIGYVIQQIGLFPHMTVSGNIGLVPSLSKMPPAVLQERTRNLLSLVKLPPEMFMDRYPRELSGGQQQRVGLARALAMDPPVLLMDEPFGALDPVLRHQLQEEFREIKARVNKTILFVTHDVEEAFSLGDRVGVMADGRLIRAGSPEELILDPGSPEVASLIGVEKKMRYLDLLSVRSLVIPVDPAFVIDADQRSGDAQAAMIALKADFLLAGHGGVPSGILYSRDLLDSQEADTKIGDLAHPVPVFDPATPAQDALSAMKLQAASTGLVADNKGVIGLLVMDEIVRRLL